jgi:hypothetical protein
MSYHDFKAYQQEEITQKLRLHKERPKARICANSLKKVNDKGFQYMVKQFDCRVLLTTLSDEVIKNMEVVSVAHVDKLKNELPDPLRIQWAVSGPMGLLVDALLPRRIWRPY